MVATSSFSLRAFILFWLHLFMPMLPVETAAADDVSIATRLEDGRVAFTARATATNGCMKIGSIKLGTKRTGNTETVRVAIEAPKGLQVCSTIVQTIEGEAVLPVKPQTKALMVTVTFPNGTVAKTETVPIR